MLSNQLEFQDGDGDCSGNYRWYWCCAFRLVPVIATKKTLTWTLALTLSR